jgi:hypothetical protein
MDTTLCSPLSTWTSVRKLDTLQRLVPNAANKRPPVDPAPLAAILASVAKSQGEQCLSPSRAPLAYVLQV